MRAITLNPTCHASKSSEGLNRQVERVLSVPLPTSAWGGEARERREVEEDDTNWFLAVFTGLMVVACLFAAVLVDSICCNKRAKIPLRCFLSPQFRDSNSRSCNRGRF